MFYYLFLYKMNQDTFMLNDLSQVKLDLILSLEEEEITKYINQLINRFYPNIEKDSVSYKHLQNNYRNSFNMEKLLRHYDFINNSFDVEYTPTGLVKSVTNNMYTFNNTIN